MSTVDLPAHPAPVTRPAAPGRLRVGWIVGPGTDLPWFIGGALSGYALFAMHAWLRWDMVTVWLVWYVVLDAPHFFGTYARTYLDREEMRRRRRLLLGSLGWLLLGPVLVLVSFLLHHCGVPVLAGAYQAPLFLLVAFVGLWAYWHVVRQHYGILSLYKRKNDDRAPIDHHVDRALLYTGLLAPFVAFVLRHPHARAGLGLAAAPPVLGTWDWGDLAVAGSALAVGLVVLVFAARQVQRCYHGEPINFLKVLFLLAVVPLHLLVCYHPATLTASLASFSAFVTIFHDLQYHAIVWHYQQRRFGRPGIDRRQYGLAALLSRNVFLYAACALGMGVAAWQAGCRLGVEPGCMPVVDAQRTLFGEVTLQTLFLSTALGLFMHHYFVDQFIWRPSRDAELRRDLNLARAEQ